MALLLLLLIVVPIVEIYVIIQVGQAIGALWTVALLIADSILGAVLMRSQGRVAWRHFSEALQAGRAPAREIVDGALVIFGGALLLTPGFVTDIFGFALLLPPSRALVRRALVRRATVRFIGGIRPPSTGGWADGRRPPGRRDYDVDGTAREVRPDPRRLP